MNRSDSVAGRFGLGLIFTRPGFAKLNANLVAHGAGKGGIDSLRASGRNLGRSR